MARKNPKPYDAKQLTKHLRELAAELHDVVVEEDGTRARTKGQALAELLFKKALGSKEKQIDDEGNEKEIIHKPESWAIQLLWDRMEGRTPQAITESEGRRTAKDKVSEIAKSTLNQLIPSTPAPPSLPTKGDEDA